MTKRQKYRDVEKFLRSQGWAFARKRGSHEIWKSEDGAMSISIVAHNGEVSPGIIRQIQAAFPDTPKKWN